MIKLLPTRVEGIDESTGTIVFTLEAYDTQCTNVSINKALTDSQFEEAIAAMRHAMNMMKLEKA